MDIDQTPDIVCPIKASVIALFVRKTQSHLKYSSSKRYHINAQNPFGGIEDAIRAEQGNLRYEYFQPIDDPETVLLIDSWTDQEAIDAHHASPMMKQVVKLREKYDLHMTMERFVSDDYELDEKYLRK